MIYVLLELLSNIFGLAGITIFVYKSIRLFKSQDTSDNWVKGIWFFGLLAFLVRLCAALYNLAFMLKAVSEAVEPDINAIAESMSMITLNTLKGLTIFTILLILWGMIKGIIAYKRQRAVHVHKH